MISIQDAQSAIAQGGEAVSSDGQRMGKLTRVYLDDDTGQPSWAGVSAGLLGRSEALVPLGAGTVEGNDIHVPFTRDEVHGAPDVDVREGHLSREDDEVLHRYFEGRRGASAAGTGGGTAGGTVGAGPVDRQDERDRAAVGSDGAPQGGLDRGEEAPSGGIGRSPAARGGEGGAQPTLVRSEERLRIRTERVPVTRVRLRKVVVTEEVTQTVPVSHEEFRLEEVPFGEVDGDDVVEPDASLSLDEGYEVILRAERIVISKEVAAVERVRVRLESVPGERVVSADVDKERVVADEIKTSGL